MSESTDLTLDKATYTHAEVAALIHSVRNGVTVDTRTVSKRDMCKGDNLRQVATGQLTVIDD